MKHTVKILFGIIVLVANAALAQEGIPARTISVTGTVENKVAPDQIVWRITLTDTDVDMRTAKAANDESVRAVVALRETLDIAEGDLETGTVNIRREYERDNQGRRGEFREFVVTRSVTIRQRDLGRFDEFLDTLVASTDMEVSFSFEASNIHEVRAETRLQALRAARGKAAAMAEVVGAELGPVITINEHPEQPGPGPLSNSAYFVSSPGVDLASDRFVPGAINVQVTVYVTFHLDSSN